VQVPPAEALGHPTASLAGYPCNHKEDNKVADAACRQLSKIQLGQLASLYLCSYGLSKIATRSDAGMPTSEQGPMEATPATLPRYSIGDAGDNKVGTVRSTHLSKGHWPALRYIGLGKDKMTERATESTRRAAGGSARVRGGRGQSFTWVVGR
jgi:hypothetical protein